LASGTDDDPEAVVIVAKLSTTVPAAAAAKNLGHLAADRCFLSMCPSLVKGPAAHRHRVPVSPRA
jgi:hypothetical protein